jgi:MFS family permease
MAQFMVVLDIAIVNVALPSIQRDLHIGQSALQWIVIAYGLMLGGFLLLGGRMADLLGRRRVLLAGLALFSAASLLAGVAGSAGFLIGARALQGFGAALVPPAALSILAVTFKEGAERNRALGLYGATAGVSASVGVIASGLLTEGPAGAGCSSSTCRSASFSSRWRRSSCPLTVRTDAQASASTSVARSP